MNWEQLTHDLGKNFMARAAKLDKDGTFAFENYKELKENKYFSATIPTELGGSGVSYKEMCSLIRIMAHYCGSTALAFSMHQHLIAAANWRYKHKGESGPMLQKVAKDQLVLVSTGARDWLESNGELTKTEGGFHLNATKHFASQSTIGDIAVTSAPYLNTNNEWQVLHFAVSLKSEGVSILNDWDTMGMRATGSQTIVFNKTFVPDSAVSLTRPRNGYHGVWDVVLVVAMPLIMSTYVGIAEKAVDLAISIGKKYDRNLRYLPCIVGKINNALVSAQTQWEAMCALTDNIDFKPAEELTIKMLSLKTNVANACIQTVNEAMQAVGGQSFYRANTLERLFRDVRAAQYHPLPILDQCEFTGSRLLAKS